MKTVRIPLAVIAIEDEADLLDLVTRVPGVVAALMDEATASLGVVVASDASALLVREQVHQAVGGSSLAMSTV